MASHASLPSGTHIDPSSFWHQLVELGRSHSDVFCYILGKLPGKLKWVELLRQVDRATRDVVSPAVTCIVHTPHSPPLQAQLDDVFPAACQLRVGDHSAGSVEVSLLLESLASVAPRLLRKLRLVIVVCGGDDDGDGDGDSDSEAVNMEPLAAPLASFLSRCANNQLTKACKQL
jgi:hypothetical protein